MSRVRSPSMDSKKCSHETASPPSPVCGGQHQIVRRIDCATERSALFDAGLPCRLRVQPGKRVHPLYPSGRWPDPHKSRSRGTNPKPSQSQVREIPHSRGYFPCDVAGIPAHPVCRAPMTQALCMQDRMRTWADPTRRVPPVFPNSPFTRCEHTWWPRRCRSDRLCKPVRFDTGHRAANWRQLRGDGSDVDVRSVDEISDPDPYDAVVFGSGVYDGSWTAEATDFVHRHSAVLAANPCGCSVLERSVINTQLSAD